MAEQQRQQPTDYWINQVNQAIMHQDIAAERNRKDAGFLFDVFNYAVSADYDRKLKAEGDKAPKGTPKTDDPFKKEGDKKIEEGTSTGATDGEFKMTAGNLVTAHDQHYGKPEMQGGSWLSALVSPLGIFTATKGLTKAAEKLGMKYFPNFAIGGSKAGAGMAGTIGTGAASALAVMDLTGALLEYGFSKAEAEVLNSEMEGLKQDLFENYLRQNESKIKERQAKGQPAIDPDELSYLKQLAVEAIAKRQGSGRERSTWLPWGMGGNLATYMGSLTHGAVFSDPSLQVANYYLKSGKTQADAQREAGDFRNWYQSGLSSGSMDPSTLIERRLQLYDKEYLPGAMQTMQQRRSGDFSFGSDPLAKIGRWTGQGASRAVGNMGKTHSRFTNALNYLKGRR